MIDYKELLNEAKKARENAYVPYSGFAVGAALLTADGKVFRGCNVENATYGATNCAERTAFFKGISEGERAFKAIAIVGGKVDEETAEPCLPCGICRQIMNEFCEPSEFEIVLENGLDGVLVYKLEQLLPHGFRLD